jgi:hypothetical protein
MVEVLKGVHAIDLTEGDGLLRAQWSFRILDVG